MLTDAAFHLRMPNHFRVSEVCSVHRCMTKQSNFFPKKMEFPGSSFDPSYTNIHIHVQNKPKSTNQKRHHPFLVSFFTFLITVHRLIL
jgi:hypothetical protein